MKKGGFAGLCFLFFLVWSTGITFGAQEKVEGSASVFFPEPGYTFTAVYAGTPVLHDFVIQNKGTGALDVKRVSGG
ncbi:MAG: hypothetical protein JRL30_24600 [Deltaproteobacteria bacterium]|nr:hypothetical protein [Deltaproteobacteria bacterium]